MTPAKPGTRQAPFMRIKVDGTPTYTAAFMHAIQQIPHLLLRSGYLLMAPAHVNQGLALLNGIMGSTGQLAGSLRTDGLDPEGGVFRTAGPAPALRSVVASPHYAVSFFLGQALGLTVFTMAAAEGGESVHCLARTPDQMWRVQRDPETGDPVIDPATHQPMMEQAPGPSEDEMRAAPSAANPREAFLAVLEQYVPFVDLGHTQGIHLLRA